MPSKEVVTESESAMNRVSVLFVVGCLLSAGCGNPLSGNYAHEIRIKRGVNQTDVLLAELEKARARDEGFVETLKLKPGGRYEHQNVDRKLEGDWWVADDGRVAVRTTHQNGRSLGALISEGADRHWEIGSDGNLYRYWNSADSDLEFVFVKK